MMKRLLCGLVALSLSLCQIAPAYAGHNEPVQLPQTPAYSGDVAKPAGSGTMTIQPNAVTAGKMGVGAAATNLGSAGGDLQGSFPNPTANGKLSQALIASAVASWGNTAYPLEVAGYSIPGDGGRKRMVYDSTNACGAGGHPAADGVTCVNSTVSGQTGSWNTDWASVNDRASVALFGSFGAGNINVDPGAFQAALNTGKDVWVPTGISGAYQLYAAASYNQATSAAQSAANTTLPFSSTTGIAVGQFVTGPGVSPSTIVTAVAANSSVTISAATSSAAVSGSIFTFTNPSILTFKASNQKIIGQDSGHTLIQCYLPSTQGTTNPCLYTNMLSGVKLRGIGMYYPGVPDTTSTTDKAPYGPLILAQYTIGMDFDDLILAAANVDVDLRGNSGNSRFTNMKFSCFSQCWQVDGSLDSNIWARSHGFPYYLTANQTTVAYSNATCWDMGRMDDFDISDSMCILSLSFNLHNNLQPTSAGGPSGRITNFDSDTHNGIAMTAGSVQCSACGFSMVANGNYAIQQFGGTLDLAAPQFFINTGITNPVVIVGGSGGINYPRMTVNGGSTLYLGTPATVSTNVLFSVGTQSGNTSGELTLMGHEVQRPAGTSANPAAGNVIVNKGTAARLTAAGNRISDIGTASGSNYFFYIQGDGYDRVIGNVGPGYTNNFPASPVNGVYQFN